MAQIPMAQGLGNQQRQVRQGVNVAGGQTAGLDALGRLAQTGVEVVRQVAEQDRKIRVYEASTKAASDIASYADELQNDTDFKTQNERYENYVLETQKTYEEQFKGDPLGHQQWKQNLDNHIERHGRSIKQYSITGQIKENTLRTDNQIGDLARLAAQTGDYDEASEKAQGLIQEGIEAGIYTPQEAQERTHKYNNELSRAEVVRDLGKDPETALAGLNGEDYASLEPEERERFKIQAQTAIANKKVKADKLQLDQDKEILKDTRLAFDIGMDVTSEEYKIALDSAKRLGTEEVEDLMVAKNAAKYMKLPSSARKELLPQVTGARNSEQVKALQDADARIKSEVNKDGYAFGIKQGLVEPVQLDLSDPQSFGDALTQKVKNAEYLSIHYGQDVSPLTEGEADMMTKAIKAMTPQDKTGLALAMGTNIKVWEQLDKKNAGLFAMAGAIGEPDIMQAIFEGQEKLANGTIKTPSKEEYLTAFDDKVGNVYKGKDRKNMLDAALAHYYATNEDTLFDADNFEESIEAVSGGIGEVNGSKIELPRGIPEDDFEDYVDEFTPDMVRHFGGVWSMSDDKAAKVIQDAQLVSIGQNRYLVTVNGMALQKPSGEEPFIVSYDQPLVEGQQEAIRSNSTNRAIGGKDAVR